MSRNITLPILIKGVIGKGKTLYETFIAREPLYCRALAGESDYHICINSDMTVSCNCQDFDGSGHIGDLREQTLEQIFSSEKVQSFQSQLFLHKFPTPTCKICGELAPVPEHRRGEGPASCAVPSDGIMLENTMRCNLNCGLCKSRKVADIRSQNFLSLDDVRQAAKEIAKHDIAQISYFSLGEPFLSKDILKELTIVREANPNSRITISTNGALIDTPDKVEAAIIADLLYFSIDGMSQESLEQYQVGGDFERSYENMKRVVAARNQNQTSTEVEWKYVLFRWNDAPEQIEEAVRLAQAAGVNRIVFYRGIAKMADQSIRFSKSPFAKTTTLIENGGFAINF